MLDFYETIIPPMVPTADAIEIWGINVDPAEVGQAVIDGGRWVYNKVKDWVTGTETCKCETTTTTEECDSDDGGGDDDNPPKKIKVRIKAPPGTEVDVEIIIE